MPTPETEWTGRYQTIEVTEWWCPTATNWVDCPGHNLCAHLTKRTRKVNAKVMRLINGNETD